MTIILNEIGSDWRDMLSRRVRESPTMLNVINALSMEYERIDDALKDLMDQCFVQTATWGLDDWERRVGLSVAPDGATIAERRMLILARLRSRFESGGFLGKVQAIVPSASVRFDSNSSQVIVRLAYGGTDEERDRITAFIEDIIPSHLVAVVQYTAFIAGVSRAGDSL